MSPTPEEQVAAEAARAGGAVAAHYFRTGVAARAKDVANLVTDADLEAERAIAAVIKRAFPGHAILGEEEHAVDLTRPPEHLWIVDPIDGTTNFAHKIPHFAVSVAYYRDGQPECGVVVNPIRDEWHAAARGRGATCNGQAVRTGAEARIDEAVVAVGFYYDRGAMMQATLDAIGDLKRAQIHGIRRFGTASLDLCMVGLGQCGAYFEFTLSPWDFAAGRLFVEEAGGRVTDAHGRPLPLGPSSILATNGLLHQPMLDALRPHLPTAG